MNKEDAVEEILLGIAASNVPNSRKAAVVVLVDYDTDDVKLLGLNVSKEIMQETLDRAITELGRLPLTEYLPRTLN